MTSLLNEPFIESDGSVTMAPQTVLGAVVWRPWFDGAAMTLKTEFNWPGAEQIRSDRGETEIITFAIAVMRIYTCADEEECKTALTDLPSVTSM